MIDPIKINAPDEITLPVEMGGTSAECWSNVQFWNSRGGEVTDLGNGRSEIDLVRQYMSLALVDRWVSLGSEVFDYNVWFRIDPTAPCPFHTPADGEPQQTWAEWGIDAVGGHAPVEIGGSWYRSNFDGTVADQVVASKWYGWITTPADGVLEVLTVEQFQAVQATATGPA